MATITVRALWSRVLVDQSQRQSATISVRVPGPNLISPSTATTGLTGSHLVGISSDGKHLVDIDPATLIATGSVSSVNGKTGAVVLAAVDVGADPAGTAATSMAAHVAELDPHTQYLLEADAATTYAVVSHTHAASAITSGTLADARLSANIPRLDTANTFTNTVTISATTAAGLVINGKSGYYPLTINRDSALGGGVGVQAGPDGSLSAITFQTTGGIRVTAFGAYVGVLAYNRIEFPSTGLDTYVAAAGNSYRLHGEASQTADLFQLLLPSSTGTRRAIYGLRPGWVGNINTDAVRKGEFKEYVYDTAERLVRSGYSDGSRGYIKQIVHTTAPADADLNPSEFAIYTDGTGLFAKLKNAGGTVYTINLAGGGGGGGSSNGRTFTDSVPVASDIQVLVTSALASGTIAGIYGARTASGTVTLSIKINGTAATGLDGVTINSTPQNITATAANTYVSEDRITVEYGAVTGSPTNLEFTIGGV